MKINAIVILSLLSTALAKSLVGFDEDWHKWKQTYKKSYVTIEEENNRRASWEKNLHFVNSHNSRPEKQFTLHMNQFADRERTIKPNKRNVEKFHSKKGIKLSTKPSSSFDWRQRGVIGPVSNEGRLGNENALVATETLASYHAIQSGRLYNLSVYETIICGCGAQLFIKDIFACIHDKIGGLCRKEDYQMNPSDRCNKNSCSAVAKVNGSVFIKQDDEAEMGLAILKTPLMVYVDASQPSFELYRTGVYSDENCSSTRIDHPMQLVGYGVHNQTRYWICKNSWGADWGNNGYIWIERGKNMCGIAKMSVYPI